MRLGTALICQGDAMLLNILPLYIDKNSSLSPVNIAFLKNTR